MKTIVSLFAALAIFAAANARAAEEWGIEGEKIARIEAKVVDIACELTGDCPADCGAGKRQLGLLKDDGTLLLVAKNSDIFAGAANDLKGFCGKRIIADGLLITTLRMPLFALQFKRLAPDGEWSRANWFIRDWSKANAGKDGDEWFRHDENVLNEIKTNGVFGIPGLKPPPD